MAGKRKVVDFHIHYSPEPLIRDRLAQLTHPDEKIVSYVQGIPSYTTHNLLHNLDRHLAMMDEAGVDIAVLSSGEGMKGNLETCRRVNEFLAEAMQKYPGRIIGMAHVPPLEGDAALQELERAHKDLGLRGAALPSTVQGKGLDSPELWPFYSKVQELGTFVFIHPALSVQTLGLQGFDKFDLYRTVGREFDLVLATIRLICGGVLDDFPNLRVVISHLAGGISALLGRIRNYQDKEYWGLAHDPVHGKTAKQPFETYLRKLFFDTGGHFGDSTAVASALLNIPPSQLLFGTDYPQEIRDRNEVREFIERLAEWDLPEAERAGILGENALRLLGL
ncbi:MAG: amidohydrolase family protein [Alicyclobacillus sp.]|nr:amidohydrolase family protein [Alicyclobacillus sp.]